MNEIGRLIVKLAGRDAGLKGVIVDILEKNYVLIDGQVRRRKCNIMHVEPLDKIIKIPKQATHEEVVKALKEEGIEVEEKRKVKKEKTEKPTKQRKKKEETEEPVKEVKKKAKKVSKKVEEE